MELYNWSDGTEQLWFKVRVVVVVVVVVVVN